MKSSQRYAVLGHPIAHSRSPAIHSAFAAQTGIDLQYEALLVPPDGLAATLHRLRDEGFSGCNITLPFKTEALTLADSGSQRALLAGAANTLGWTTDGRLWADNTDGLGLRRDIETNANWPLLDRRLLLLGAGGAAAGALGPLLEARPACVAVWNRSPARAAELVARHAELALRCGVRLLALERPEGRFDAVINATSAALQAGALDLPAGLLAPGGLALDMVYGAAAEPFLAWAAGQQAGQRRDGLGMLVEQAAEAFQRWHGLRPDTAAVLAQLRSGA